MTRRLKALFMLLVFGLVLPAAGAPQRFCAREFTFVHQSCCSAKHCKDCPDEKAPVKPTCFVAAKVVPDGVNPQQVDLPPLSTFFLPAFVLPEPLEIQLVSFAGDTRRDRAPPGKPRPLYLTHRSLLI